MISTITHILVLIIGALLGSFIVYKFNVPDTQINGKIKAKKGGRVDYKLINAPIKEKVRKLFTRKNK